MASLPVAQALHKTPTKLARSTQSSMRFSERMGFTPVRTALQSNSIDDGLRNKLWNFVEQDFTQQHLSSATRITYRTTNKCIGSSIYRNSIKESILSIESLSKLISGQPKGTLGTAIKAVEKTVSLHPVLGRRSRNCTVIQVTPTAFATGYWTSRNLTFRMPSSCSSPALHL